jgi:hypothetical protein
MKTLFKPKVTVEQIHAEFDAAEQKIIEQCNSMLNELNIPTESNIERKGAMLKELGFVNSETAKQAESLIQKRKSLDLQKESYMNTLKTINEFKVRYPDSKFITIDQLEHICEKYELIHAPAANYIKDIPEKNVLEMANRKTLYSEDKHPGLVILKLKKECFEPKTPKKIVNKCIEGIEVKDSGFISNNDEINNYFKLPKNTYYYKYNTTIRTIIQIDKNGLFIAAPKSHFNLEGLNKKSKFGFFNVTVTEIKDPVVFEYCKNNIVRIVTKWGTEDDKAYLDPILNDEKLN